MNRRQTAATTIKPSPKRAKYRDTASENLIPFVVKIKDPADFKTSPMFYKMIFAGLQRKLRKLI